MSPLTGLAGTVRLRSGGLHPRLYDVARLRARFLHTAGRARTIGRQSRPAIKAYRQDASNREVVFRSPFVCRSSQRLSPLSQASQHRQVVGGVRLRALQRVCNGLQARTPMALRLNDLL